MNYRERRKKLNCLIENSDRYLLEFYGVSNYDSRDNSNKYLHLNSLFNNIKFICRKKKIPAVIGDIDIFDEVVVQNCYGIDVSEFKNSINIVDIGANIGAFSWLLLSECTVKNLVCIEPDDDAYKVLKMNMRIYTNSNIELHNSACGILPEELYFKSVYNSGGGNFCKNTRRVDKGEIKKKFVLSDLFKLVAYNEYWDIIKIDTEGSELEIIRELIGLNIKIKHLFLEIHGSENEKDIFNRIKELGHGRIDIISRMKVDGKDHILVHSQV